MIIEANISWGYLGLLETFFKANELAVVCTERIGNNLDQITLHYEDNSDTAYSLTVMSLRHCGIENMLCDYLIRCGIPAGLIPIGRGAIKRDMAKVDQAWEEYRKTIGLQ